MRQRARVLGVREEQLVFTNTSNIVEFVRRCGLADLVLDTYPVSAHTVAMDVLWMGTPLLTRPGESFASRQLPVRPEMKSSRKLRQANALAVWGCTCHCPLKRC